MHEHWQLQGSSPYTCEQSAVSPSLAVSLAAQKCQSNCGHYQVLVRTCTTGPPNLQARQASALQQHLVCAVVVDGLTLLPN